MTPKNKYAVTSYPMSMKPKPQTSIGAKPYYSISDVLNPKKPSFSENYSATNPSAPKQAYAQSLSQGGGYGGGVASQSTPAKPDYSSLMPGLKNLSTALGEYAKSQSTANSTSPVQNKPATPDYYSGARSAMQDYINSLRPSQEEQDKQRSYDNLTAATRAGVARQEEDAIPMNFITGRQQTIENRGRELTEPLANELNRLASDRQAMSAGQKARYEFEQGLAKEQYGYDREDTRNQFLDTRDETRYQDGQLQMVDNNVVRIKPDGTSEVIYKGDPKIETQIVQSNGRNILINSKTGETIANLGATEGALTRANSGSGGVAGNVGSLASMVMENPALYKGLTPTQKASILRELSGAGFDTSLLTMPELTMGQRDSIAGYDDLLREAQNISSQIDGMNTGQIAGRVGTVASVFGLNEKFTNLRSSIDNMASQLLMLRSGAAVTPQEYERIKGFIPRVTDDENTVAQKTARFIEETQAAQQNYLKTATQSTYQLSQQGNKSNLPKTRVVNGVTYTLQPDGTYE